MDVIQQALASCGLAMSRMEEVRKTEKIYNLCLY